MSDRIMSALQPGSGDRAERVLQREEFGGERQSSCSSPRKKLEREVDSSEKMEKSAGQKRMTAEIASCMPEMRTSLSI